MRNFICVIIGVLLSQNAFSKNCLSGKFGNQTYQVVDEETDGYGNYKTKIIFSKYGEVSGKGRYFATQEEAYLEAKYTNRETKIKAVVSTSFQQDGSLFTLCAGTDLKDASKYNCISCVDNR